MSETDYGILWTKRTKIASGPIVTLEPGSETEKERGVDDGDNQDRNKSRD